MTPHVQLWELDVRDTQITNLDLSQNTALYGVSTDTVLKELDVTTAENMPVNRLAAVGNGFVGITTSTDGEFGRSLRPDGCSRGRCEVYRLVQRQGMYEVDRRG